MDPSATDVAIQGLNGMELGDKRLKVEKASIGITQVAGIEMGVNAMSMLAGTTSSDAEESRVLQLLNMVTPEELMDNDDYEGRVKRRVLSYTEKLTMLEICDDVREECSKFGTVAALKVPRPVGGSRQSAGVGKIFVKFESQESAAKGLRALAGRKFADRTVVTTYFPEVFLLPSPTSDLVYLANTLWHRRRTLKLALGKLCGGRRHGGISRLAR